MSDRFTAQFLAAPEQIQRTFGKQLGHLLRDLRHPSLRAKNFGEASDLWQGRVDLNWRFYFSIDDAGYYLHEITPHPK